MKRFAAREETGLPHTIRFLNARDRDNTTLDWPAVSIHPILSHDRHLFVSILCQRFHSRCLTVHSALHYLCESFHNKSVHPFS